MINYFTKRASRPFKGKRIFYSKDGAETATYSHAKEWSYTPTSHHVQKVTKWINVLNMS